MPKKVFMQVDPRLKAIWNIKFKGMVIQATVFFNLSRSIVALQVETLCCEYYHVSDQLVSQQNTVL